MLQTGVTDLHLGARQHGMTEIRGDDERIQSAMKLESQVACTAAQVEVDSGRARFCQGLQPCRRDAPPTPINRSGEKMVQEVITVCDVGEHPLNRWTMGAMGSLRYGTFS